MKLITLLITVFLLNCGGANNGTVMAEKTNKLTSGPFTVSKVNGDAYSNLTVEFDTQTQKVSGFSGCNRFFGDYTVNGNQLNFGALATTHKMCSPEDNIKEQHLLKALAEVNAFDISGTTLQLKNNEATVLVAEQKSDNKIAQSENPSVDYSEVSRGSYKNIAIDNKRLSWVNERNAKAQTLTLNDTEWARVLELVNAIDLSTIPELEAPSKAHQYDGAAIGSLTVIKNGKTYRSQAFDAGNPNTILAAVIEKMIGLTNNK
ncbi:MULTISPECIES: META domain-containing protein [Bizionia]|nr:MULTISPECIES: META domain-containing protein [Bizionia]